MEISQHIKELLITNERVILDGFGAFITKQMSAKYDEATKTMKPPYKIATFDPEIKSAAGLLSQHIANKENISRAQVIEQITEYVKTINFKLDNGEMVIFEGLGNFIKSPDGNLDFTFLSQDNLLQKSFGMTEVSVDKSNTTINTQKKEPKKKVIEQKKKPIKKTIEKPQKKEKVKKESKKRKKLPIFLLLFLLAIGLVLTALYFFKPKLWKKAYTATTEKVSYLKNKISGNDKYEIIKPGEASLDTLSEKDTIAEGEAEYNNYEDEDDIDAENETDNNIDESEDMENSTDEEILEGNNETDYAENGTISEAQAGSYYIIVSSVKSENEAAKEQSRFLKKGINTTVINAGKGRFRISMGEFSSAIEAQKFFEKAQTEHGTIDAWVWEKK